MTNAEKRKHTDIITGQMIATAQAGLKSDSWLGSRHSGSTDERACASRRSSPTTRIRSAGLKQTFPPV
jgi:hypothetical protein